MEFNYYAPSGENIRLIEPYYLVFQWSSWYVWGWCRTREDYRLFKLNRMDRVAGSDQEFVCRDAPMLDLSNEKIFPGGIRVKALFAPDMNNLVTWLLTFGAKVEVLEPVEVRDMIRRNAEETIRIYKEG